MELDDLKEFLQDEGNAIAFSEIVKAMGYESADEVSGLKANRDKALKSLQKFQLENQKLSDKAKIVDSMDMDAYHDYINGKNTGSMSDPSQLQKRLEKAEFDKVELEKKLGERTANLHKVLQGSELSKSLDGAGYKEHKQILQQVLLGRTKVESNGEVYIADDNGIDTPIKDYFNRDFKTSELGLQYKDIPKNAGANSQGLNGGSASKVMGRSEYGKLSEAEGLAFTNNGGSVTD